MTYEKPTDADAWLVDERRHPERDSRDIAPWAPPADRHAQRWMQGETLAVYGKRWIAERPLKSTSRGLYESNFAHHIVLYLHRHRHPVCHR